MCKLALISWVLCVVSITSVQSAAKEAALAMLYTKGASWLNGLEVPKSEAIFAGDVVQTGVDSTSSIFAAGSSITILSNSLVLFEGPELKIEHGIVRVSSSREVATKAGEITVKPISNQWTVFTMARKGGHIVIVADKGDVTVQDQHGTTTLSQGQQASRDEEPKPKKKNTHHNQGGAVPAARGGILSSTSAIVGGGLIIGGIGIWTILQDPPPMSPSCPSNPCQ
jgi:hypothetical protein